MLGRFLITFFAVLLGLFAYRVFEPAVFDPAREAVHEKIYASEPPETFRDMVAAYLASQFMGGTLLNCQTPGFDALDERAKPRWKVQCRFHATFYLDGGMVDTRQMGGPVLGTFYLDAHRVTGHEMVSDLKALR